MAPQIDLDLYTGSIVQIFDCDDEEEECLGFSDWESLKTNSCFRSHQIQ